MKAERLVQSPHMKRLPDSPCVEHRSILDTRLAFYREGKSKPISILELMRRVRGSEKFAPTPNRIANSPQPTKSTE